MNRAMALLLCAATAGHAQSMRPYASMTEVTMRPISAQGSATCGDPPGSPVLWVDGTDPLDGVAVADGAALGAGGTLVVNKGSLGGTFSATATAEPIFNADCIGGTSKRGCIRFDGVNDALTSSAAAASWAFLHSTDYTCSAVVRFPLFSPELTYPIMATAGSATSQVGHIFAMDDAGSAEQRLRVEQKNGGSVTNNRILQNAFFPNQIWTRATITFDNALVSDKIVGYLEGVSSALSGAELAVPSVAAPSNTLALGSFGNVTGSFMDGDLVELVCYSSVLSATDLSALNAWEGCIETATPYGPRPGRTLPSSSALCDPLDDPCYVGVMGDSITSTLSPLTWANGYMRTTTYPRTHIFQNAAVGGTTIEIAKTNQWANDLALDGIHVLMMLIGTNDIGLNSTPAVDILADIDEVADSAIAQGVKVVTISILPRCSNYGGACATLQPIQDAVNAGLASAADGALRFHADVYADMEEPPTTDNLLVIYDSGDGLHPNQTGQDALGAFIDGLVDLTP